MSEISTFKDFLSQTIYFVSDPITKFFQELLEVVPPPQIADEDEIENKNAVENQLENKYETFEAF